MTRKRLGELLVEAGLLSGAQLEGALAHQRQWGGRLGRIVVQMGFTPEPRMLRILAGHLGVPLADPPADDLNPRIIDQIPADLATRWMVFPLAMRRDVSGEALVVAMSDPTSAEAVDAIRQHTGRIVYVALAGDASIEAWIRRHYFGEGRSRPPSDTAIPLVTGALATPAPQPSPLGRAAANPFASAIVQPLTVDDPFAVLDLKPVEVPGSRTSAGMVGLAELQPISANADVVDLEPIREEAWSPPPAPVFDTSGGFLSSDDDDVGALPPPNPFMAPSFGMPSNAAPLPQPPAPTAPPSYPAPSAAPSFAAPSLAAPPLAAPPLAPPSFGAPAPAPPPARPGPGQEGPFGAFPSTIALVEMPAPHPAPAPSLTAPASSLAGSWADELAVAPPTPAPELPPPTLAPQPPVASVAPAAIGTCPRCTSPRVEGARFCPFCGMSFVAASTPPTPAPTPPLAAAPGLATHFSDIPVSAEAMPTPIATGVLVLDDDVVESAMARRGTPMPMPSLAVIHALDAIAMDGPPPPSPFDALTGPAPGDAGTDAIAVALPDTHPLGEPIEAPGDEVGGGIDGPGESAPIEVESAPIGSALIETAPIESAPIESPPIESPPIESPPIESPPIESPPIESAPDAGSDAMDAIDVVDVVDVDMALPAPPQDPATATSVGLTLVAVEPPAPAPALDALESLPASIEVAARGAWDETPMAPPVAVALDPATATSVGLTLVAVEVGDAVPVAAAADPVSATSVGLSLVAVESEPEPAGSEAFVLDAEVEVGVEASDTARPLSDDAAADDIDMSDMSDVSDGAVEVADGDVEADLGIDAAPDIGGEVDAGGSPLASQWADAAERPIPRQETDTRNALGWIPPSREILVVPEEAGPAPEPVQAYAPAAAPRVVKPAVPWARFAPKAAAPEPAPPVDEPEAAPTIELIRPEPDSDASATLEMKRPFSVEVAEVPAAAPVPTLRIDRALLTHATDVDADPALPTEPHTRPVLDDDDILITRSLARPDMTPGTDVDGEPALPTLQMTSPPAGLLADQVDLAVGLNVDVDGLADADGPVAEAVGAPIEAEAWSLNEPGLIELTSLPAPLPAAAVADPWSVPSTEAAPEPAGPVALASAPTPVPASTGAPEDEVVELAPWPGSPGAADGPPPMKLTPTMVMRMDPAEQRKLLALLLEKANVGPDVLGKPGDPDKPSS